MPSTPRPRTPRQGASAPGRGEPGTQNDQRNGDGSRQNSAAAWRDLEDGQDDHRIDVVRSPTNEHAVCRPQTPHGALRQRLSCLRRASAGDYDRRSRDALPRPLSNPRTITGTSTSHWMPPTSSTLVQYTQSFVIADSSDESARLTA